MSAIFVVGRRSKNVRDHAVCPICSHSFLTPLQEVSEDAISFVNLVSLMPEEGPQICLNTPKPHASAKGFRDLPRGEFLADFKTEYYANRASIRELAREIISNLKKTGYVPIPFSQCIILAAAGHVAARKGEEQEIEISHLSRNLKKAEVKSQILTDSLLGPDYEL